MKKTLTTIGLATGLLISTQASALRCALPAIEKAYNDHTERRDTGVVMIGRFTNVQPMNQNLPMRTLRFNGQAYAIPTSSPTPPNIPTLRFLRLQVNTISPWTTQIPTNGEYIVFGTKTDNTLVATTTIGPCPSKFYEKSAENLQRLQTCFASGC